MKVVSLESRRKDSKRRSAFSRKISFRGRKVIPFPKFYVVDIDEWPRLGMSPSPEIPYGVTPPQPPPENG